MKTKDRIDQTAEFFTPMPLVNELINKVTKSANKNVFKDAFYSVLDPTCGNGQFIMGILIKKSISYVHADNVDMSYILEDLIHDYKMEALKETYGVDLMASNIADLIARIVFWKTWNIEIFDKVGAPKSKLMLLEYPNEDTVYWLKKHVEAGQIFSRTYVYNEQKVTIRNHPKKWWTMQYYIHNWNTKAYTGGGFCSNFVVADGLKYDFEFNGKEPQLETKKQTAERRIKETLLKKKAQEKDILNM